MTTDIQIKKQFQNYLDSLKFSASYVQQLQTFLDFCKYEEIRYEEIKFQYLTAYLLTLNNKGLSEGYINNKIKAVRKFYEFLYKNEVVGIEKYELTKKLLYQKVPEKLRDTITEKDLEKVCKKGMTYMSHVIQPRKLKAMLYLTFYTGIRKGELINLKREDINLEKLTAKIKLPTKSKKERIVGFNIETREILKKYFEKEKEDRNCFNIIKSQLQTIMGYLKIYIPEKNLTWSSLRHGFARMLASKNVNITTAQKLMGHSKLATTEIYYKVSNETALKEYFKIINKNRRFKKKFRSGTKNNDDNNNEDLVDLEEEGLEDLE